MACATLSGSSGSVGRRQQKYKDTHQANAWTKFLRNKAIHTHLVAKGDGLSSPSKSCSLACRCPPWSWWSLSQLHPYLRPWWHTITVLCHYINGLTLPAWACLIYDGNWYKPIYFLISKWWKTSLLPTLADVWTSGLLTYGGKLELPNLYQRQIHRSVSTPYVNLLTS